MKYIDAYKLKNELESIYDNMLKRIKIDKDNSDYWGGKADAYRNVIDTITSLQLEQQEESDKDLEEAAKEYASDYPAYNDEQVIAKYAFKRGAEWQAEQDDRDVIFWKGMQYAIKGMKEEAAEGVVQDHGQFISFGDGKYIDLDPTLENKPIVDLADGDKVCVLIIKDDGKSD